MNLFLDDIRVPSMSHNDKEGLGIDYASTDKWVIIKDYFNFIDIIDKHFDEIKLISFDHDLACVRDGREYTGKDAVDYVINFCLDNGKLFPNWYAHTDNTSGRENIIGAIKSYLKRIENRDLSGFRYYHNGIINNKFVA